MTFQTCGSIWVTPHHNAKKSSTASQWSPVEDKGHNLALPSPSQSFGPVSPCAAYGVFLYMHSGLPFLLFPLPGELSPSFHTADSSPSQLAQMSPHTVYPCLSNLNMPVHPPYCITPPSSFPSNALCWLCLSLLVVVVWLGTFWVLSSLHTQTPHTSLRTRVFSVQLTTVILIPRAKVARYKCWIHICWIK